MMTTVARTLVVLFLSGAAALAAPDRPLEGYWVTEKQDWIELKAGAVSNAGTRTARGTLTIDGVRHGCHFMEDRSGNWMFGLDGAGEGGYARVSPDLTAIDLPQNLRVRIDDMRTRVVPQETFRRRDASTPRPVVRPRGPSAGDPVAFDVPRKEGEVLEVSASAEEWLRCEPIPTRRDAPTPDATVETWTFTLAYLERIAALRDGHPSRVERHVLRSAGVPGRPGSANPVRNELEGRSYVLELQADGTWSASRAGGDVLTRLEEKVLGLCPVAHAVHWPPRAELGNAVREELRAPRGGLPASCTPLVASFVRSFDALVKRDAELTGSVYYHSSNPAHRSLDVTLHTPRATPPGAGPSQASRGVRLSQGLRLPAQEFPALPATPAAGSTPLARGLVDQTIEAALASAREERKLLVVVFLATDDRARADTATVINAMEGQGMAALKDKFLFVRRPHGDDLGLPTPEAEAHRADRSPTFVAIDPWADLSRGPPYPTLTVISDPATLAGGLQRALLEAARAQHPPPPSRR